MSQQQNKKSLLICGAGYLGQAIATVASPSWAVTGLRRQPNVSSLDGSSNLQWVAADVLAPSSLQKALSGRSEPFKAAVYCVSAGAKSTEAYHRAYQVGFSNLIKVLDPAVRLIFVSTTGVYPETNGGWVDEQTLVDESAVLPMYREILYSERQALERGNAVVLRFSGIYGPNRIRAIQAALNAPQMLEVREIAYTNRIHVEDGARAVVHCLASNLPTTTYCVTDSEPAPLHEIIAWIKEQRGLKFSQVICGSDADHLPKSNKRVSNSRLAATGFTWNYPSYREGYRSLLETFSN